MRLEPSHTGAEAQRSAQEPAPFSADWPDVAYKAEPISEPYERAHLCQLLAYDADGNEVGRRQIG